MSRALLLLDVDGPLNVYAADPDGRQDGYTEHRLEGFRVWLNPGHGPLLCEFATRHDVELAWATTWEDLANTSIGPVVGLPELPVVDLGWQRKVSGTITTTDHWKFDGVLDHAAGRPLAWLDDDFGLFPEGRAWFERERGDTPTLLHHVDPRVGLTPADLDAVAGWLATALGERQPR